MSVDVVRIETERLLRRALRDWVHSVTLLITILAITNMAVGYGLAVYFGKSQAPLQIKIGSFRRAKAAAAEQAAQPLPAAAISDAPAQQPIEQQDDQPVVAQQVPQLDVKDLLPDAQSIAAVADQTKTPADSAMDPAALLEEGSADNLATDSLLAQEPVDAEVAAVVAEQPEQEVEATAELQEVEATAELQEIEATAELQEIEATAELQEIEATAELQEIEATAELQEIEATAEPPEVEDLGEQQKISAATEQHESDGLAIGEESASGADEETASAVAETATEEIEETGEATAEETVNELDDLAQQLRAAAESSSGEEDDDEDDEAADLEAVETVEIDAAQDVAAVSHPEEPGAQEPGEVADAAESTKPATAAPLPKAEPAAPAAELPEADVQSGLESFQQQLQQQAEQVSSAEETLAPAADSARANTGEPGAEKPDIDPIAAVEVPAAPPVVEPEKLLPASAASTKEAVADDPVESALEGIEAFQAQLQQQQAAAGVTNDLEPATEPVAEPVAKAAEDVAKAPAATAAAVEEALDPEVLAGIEAFRSQLSQLKDVAPQESVGAAPLQLATVTK